MFAFAKIASLLVIKLGWFCLAVFLMLLAGSLFLDLVFFIL